MDFPFFLKGVGIGLWIAMPVGPIGVLCIRRSLADGPRTGFVVGLGAATADAAYGCIAGFGLTAISNFLVGGQFWLGLLGGLFLLYLGVRTFLSRPPEEAAAVRTGSLASAYFSTLLLTLTNPMTIIAFLGVFTGLGVVAASNYLAATALVFGVFIGSALWWLLLSNGVGLFRSRVNSSWLLAINRVSGGVIVAFGLYAMLKLFRV